MAMCVIEVLDSSYEQRQEIKLSLEVRWEKLDQTTFNVLIEESDIDSLTDMLDEYGLEWRLI